MGETPHTAGWVYHLWSGGQDHYEDDLMEHLQSYHGGDGMQIFECHNCGTGVHCGGKGYNEQTAAYVRFGPVFICGECMNEAFDLPDIHSNWPNETR